MSENNGGFGDKEMMYDILAEEKSLVKSYSDFITEASCTELRNVLTDNLDRSGFAQYQAFDMLRQRSWYDIKPVPAQMVAEAKSKFTAL